MKKIYTLILLVMTGIMANAQTSLWDGNRKLWTRGEGTASSPYLIESAENLAFLSYMVNKGFETKDLYFALTTDIDLNGNEDLQWTPIGIGLNWFYEDGCQRGSISSYGFEKTNSFRGHFDGGGHTIYNLYINGGNVAGLFGLVTDESSIENLGIVSGYIREVKIGGAIAGKCDANVTISNCTNHLDISGEQVGGIVGFGAKAISRCLNTGNIKGTSSAGGISATSTDEITECYNTGNILSYGSGGGIIGNTQKRITLMNCYNTGNVEGAGQGIGGIGGIIKKGLVKNCYNVGNVGNTQGPVGGIIGNGFNGTVENIYYLNTCGGEGLGEPMSDIEMLDPAFVTTLNLDTDVWGYDENHLNDGYPILTTLHFSVDETADNLMSVYPNPAKGCFTVEGNGLLTIVNLLGQKIMEQEVESRASITLPEGIYLLRLCDGNRSITRKIVIY